MVTKEDLGTNMDKRDAKNNNVILLQRKGELRETI